MSQTKEIHLRVISDGQSVTTNFRKIFDRDECACEKCVACCRHKPGVLMPEDLTNILHLAEERAKADGGKDWYKWATDRTAAAVEYVEKHFEASEGALVVWHGKPVRVSSLVPKLLDSGCVFLKDGKCSIWEVSPAGCSHFSACEEDSVKAAEANTKMQMLLQAIMTAFQHDSWYAKFWRWLWDEDQRAPPLMERQRNLSNAFDEIENGRSESSQR